MNEKIAKIIEERITSLAIARQTLLDQLQKIEQVDEQSRKKALELNIQYYMASGALAELKSLRSAVAKPTPRVIATEEALAFIHYLKEKHGPLMFHQSGGCCDGSSPMCYPLGEFIVGDNDVLLGEIGGCPFYMSKAQFEYWQHTQLIIDTVPGRGGMFSLDSSEGKRFLTRSRIFTADERSQLEK